MIFEILFFRLWQILGPLEGSKGRPPLPFFRSFFDPGGYFFCSGVIFGNVEGFCCSGNYFPMIFNNFLALFLPNVVSFCEARFWQKSPRVCQDPGGNRQYSDQPLHKYQRQEFSRVRRSSRMRTQSAALRREWWRL